MRFFIFGKPVIVSLILLLATLPTLANLRIMSYNIENFWLRFDGKSGTITSQGAELDKDDLKKLEIIASIIYNGPNNSDIMLRYR